MSKIIDNIDTKALRIDHYEEWEQNHIIKVINAYRHHESKKEKFKMIHELIKNHQMHLTKLIPLFDVSISGYYKWLEDLKIDQVCPIKKRNMDLIEKICKSHKHYVGCRKIQKILETQYNVKLNYKTINLYMNKMDLCKPCHHDYDAHRHEHCENEE
ncbi:IS3 family transposase [Ureaplasma urealyticum]|uniref:Transposase n=3 Tax=Ureaplasma urealyticum TaxID=2130 RepID=A0AAP9ACL9_UREUR|nr:IS3 family transposase [Ureaplasma urealyticum]EDX53773.1 conserved hypothetical protein [Ureaplasma urealyticum serovar 9 str. ATCC 33175]ACI59726.1 conserved hypothetical protein [Ureaplasma urealyticum serovar 10 str. ATCC 33699]EDU06210.1 conserved hypothetical protein [Ureaplasma urealyticum serovar 5 str. ATCC 27817]EDU57201.1 conserved hypothetical protein [Ureaplasma urealyticum serovar 7 str. ATCC 27819]EDU67074.1 conserved hypothetical protein [Ureaplasma urealyticum serovar 11 st